jgi:hypothetical protein
MILNEYDIGTEGMVESVESRVNDPYAIAILEYLDETNTALRKNPIKIIDFDRFPVKTECIEVSRVLSYNTDRELKDIWVENSVGKRLHWFDLEPEDRQLVYKRVIENKKLYDYIKSGQFEKLLVE